MRRWMQRRLEAYGDGALPRGARERVERLLSDDPRNEAHLRRTRALGNLIRDCEGDVPPPPRPEQLFSVLRPAMRAIDAERDAAPRWQRVRDELESWARPAGIAFASAAAVVLLFAVPSLLPSGGDAERVPVARAPSEAPRATLRTPYARAQLPVAFDDGVARNVGVPQSVYDLAQGETPLMLFEADDGATVIWLLGDAEPASSFATPGGWA